MVEYPPYVNAYGQLKDLFAKIKEAQVPTRFTQDFMYSMLGLKSRSFRPMIPFLKKLGFLNEANSPTKVYSDYRDDSLSAIIMAEQIKRAYATLFSASEYAYTLSKDQLISKLATVLGTSKDDRTMQNVASTFQELCKLADFKAIPKSPIGTETEQSKSLVVETPASITSLNSTPPRSLGISYTINLNLPPTTDPKVFDAIFKSLKEHLLK